MAIAAVLISLAATGPASAATPPGNPLQDVSAIDQYVEAIPTSSGPAATGGGSAKPRPLPPDVASEIREQGGNDADALMEVATSPRYGAPTGSGDSIRPEDSSEAAQTQPSPLEALVSPIAEADETRLLVLLALLGGMTLVAFARAAQRQRQ